MSTPEQTPRDREVIITNGESSSTGVVVGVMLVVVVVLVAAIFFFAGRDGAPLDDSNMEVEIELPEAPTGGDSDNGGEDSGS